MNERLPDRIDPIRLAQRGARLTGRIPQTGMARLATAVAEVGGDVEVELDFGRDERGAAVVSGHIRTELLLSCQNCLEPFRMKIDARPMLGVVESEAQAERLPEPYEPLLVGAEPIYIKDLVEDELLLALPIIARHPAGECPEQGQGADGGEQKDERHGKENPFAVLSQLKKNRKS